LCYFYRIKKIYTSWKICGNPRKSVSNKFRMNKEYSSINNLNSSDPLRYYAPHVVPFLLLAVCIYLGPLLNLPKILLYPLQTVLVAGSLIFYWKAIKQEIKFSFDVPVILAGVFVFFIWIFSENLYPQIGNSDYNPYQLASGSVVYLLMAIRLIGATLIIPLAEELFWRSFALRLLIKSEFKSVPLGKFSWFSFIVASIAFGFEHHRWLPGIVAGMVYAGVLYRSKNLFAPILAHAVTNLLLGIYVILTQQWQYW